MDIQTVQVTADYYRDLGQDGTADRLQDELERYQLTERLVELLALQPGGSNERREQLVRTRTAQLTIAELRLCRFAVCSDEKTGVRFGSARKRAGRCEKIGSTTYKYQLWLVWN